MPEVVFYGSAGRIEGRYYQHLETKGCPVAIILHPTPKFGGTMNNQVVYALYRTFAELGFNTLRFNFRGVGRSQGTFDNGEGELNDAASALNWLQDLNPNASGYWVAGFSFGAWIGMQLLMRRPELEGFVSISPLADRYDWGFLAPCPSPGLIMQGDDDEIVSQTSVANLVHRLQQQRGLNIDCRRVPGADHFFENKLDVMCRHVKEYLLANMLRNSSIPPSEDLNTGSLRKKVSGK